MLKAYLYDNTAQEGNKLFFNDLEFELLTTSVLFKTYTRAFQSRREEQPFENYYLPLSTY